MATSGPENKTDDTMAEQKSSLALVQSMLAAAGIASRARHTTRFGVLVDLAGETFKIPDLTNSACPSYWKPKLHPQAADLRRDIEDFLELWCPSDDVLAHLQGLDIGGLAAAWAHDAEYKHVCWVAYFFAWFCLWNEEAQEDLPSVVDAEPTVAHARSAVTIRRFENGANIVEAKDAVDTPVGKPEWMVDKSNDTGNVGGGSDSPHQESASFEEGNNREDLSHDTASSGDEKPTGHEHVGSSLEAPGSGEEDTSKNERPSICVSDSSTADLPARSQEEVAEDADLPTPEIDSNDNAAPSRCDAIGLISELLLADCPDDLLTSIQAEELGCAFYDYIAHPLREAYDHGRRRLLSEEIKSYVTSGERGSKMQKTETLPSIEEFWQRRMKGSEFKFLLMATELVAGVRLPEHILRHPEMQNLFNAALEHTWIVNDILSFHRQTELGYIGFVGLIFAQKGDLTFAIDVAVAAASHAAGVFERSARHLAVDLMNEAGETESFPMWKRLDVLLDLRKFVNACRSSCIGSLAWGYATPCYKMKKFSKDSEGAKVVKLPLKVAEDLFG
ncbi:hypothetical protein M011DRAFT_458397 [Sporormia fimetaria CBS 119925]|uniref:Terpenoid synthase n=1 Tax=Sporormia fimetaria CBS 119925 TaxID=1340428 RepID=A0A6A6VEL0_9PLEO|nr:hypothetical protein M011DRAFT_458397 [Sporormia fimetaria CBS 119925]